MAACLFWAAIEDLRPEALDVLNSIERGSSPYLFSCKDRTQRTDFMGPWLKIRKATGLQEGFRFHGLWHHFASTLISNGVDLAVVGKLLSHKQAQTAMRYAHLKLDAVREAANQAGKLISMNKKNDKVL